MWLRLLFKLQMNNMLLSELLMRFDLKSQFIF